MRMIRSRHSRSSDSSLKDVKKFNSKAEASLFPYSNSSLTLLGLAVLPLIVMCLVSFWSFLLEHPLFSTRKRIAYSFDWGEAIELRSHLSAKYNTGPYLPNGVPRRQDMSVAEFRDMWDCKWPLIISDVVPNWRAFQWSKDFLYKFYSKSNLTVTQTKGHLSQSFGSVIPLGEFYKQTFEKATSTSWTYVTDEHFITNHPPLQSDIGVNKFAEGDYFELFPEEIRPKNAMLLWGTKHSRSHLHIDPYNWTGTVALLKGTKRWKLWPPNPVNGLNLTSRRSGFPLDCPILVSNIDSFSKTRVDVGTSQYSIEIEQMAGDLLVIPTGWAHQAYNVEETLAISSQFMNKNNYRTVLEELIKCAEIESELPDAYMTFSPEEQVKTVVSLIPNEMMEKAKQTNAEMRERLMHAEDAS